MVKLFNISWSYILILYLDLGQVTEYPPAKTEG